MNRPFLDYAITCWHHHTSKYGHSDDDLFLMLDRLIEPKSKSFSSCLHMMKAESRPGKVSPLYVAASKGLASYTAHLLEIGHDINARDVQMRTPLHLASKEGHHKVVSVLLQEGATSDMDEVAGLKSLHITAARNFPKTVKLVLESGVDRSPLRQKNTPEDGAAMLPQREARRLSNMLVRTAIQASPKHSSHTWTQKDLVRLFAGQLALGSQIPTLLFSRHSLSTSTSR
jgi:ankyrin repeat protein